MHTAPCYGKLKLVSSALTIYLSILKTYQSSSQVRCCNPWYLFFIQSVYVCDNSYQYQISCQSSQSVISVWWNCINIQYSFIVIMVILYCICEKKNDKIYSHVPLEYFKLTYLLYCIFGDLHKLQPQISLKIPVELYKKIWEI